MYNFNLEKGESLYSVFDEVLVKQGNNQKVVSVALTDKRILFLDFVSREPYETLKGAQASNYIKIKEVFYYRNLNEIKEVKSSTFYEIKFNDSSFVEFDNEELFKALKEL